MQIRKEKYFVLNEFHAFILFLYAHKMKIVVTKYVVCYRNNKCFKVEV